MNTGSHGTGGPEPLRRRTNKKWSLALGGMLIVFVALAGYDLIAGGALGGGSAAPSPKAPARHGTVRKNPAPTAPAASASTAPVAQASPAGSPAQALTVASVAAFGPEGTSDGDNPAIVSRVIDGGGAWYSSWYTTPEFGELKTGTGILLDMGAQVTVSSVQVVLGDAAGADLQVRVGDTAVLGDMSTAASVSDAGGTVRLPLSSPATARYVLIWFTRLPPDSSGTYQASVYSATVDGHR